MTKRTKSTRGSPSKRSKPGAPDYTDLDEACVNTIRVLAADVVDGAMSGHPGAPMGCAPIAYLLWKEWMDYSPAHPDWMARDRFVLSNGHACALQYIMLHLTGYDLTLEDLQQFRQVGSRTPGHPENFATPGVEVCTGPLGQGISQAVGMAIAETNLAATYNKPGATIVDNYTWVICGDGCLQEGISSETSSLAGHLQLGKLIVFYDDNSITIDGDTALSFTEDIKPRYEGYGWQVIDIPDVTDLAELHIAIRAAKANENQPTMIRCKTRIGHGSSLEGSEKAHGAALGAEVTAALKRKLGFDPEAHYAIRDDVKAAFMEGAARGEAAKQEWEEVWTRYADENSELAEEFLRRKAGRLADGWEDVLPTWKPEDDALATRKTSGACLKKLASHCENLIGGSADLTPSNGTGDFQKTVGDYQAASPAGRYIRYGVREHGMTAIANGITAYGGYRPFVATFLNFIGYALGAVRITALSKFPVVFLGTHDSIFLGEDGPTHQPVEMLEVCRSIPNLNVIRPADGKETSGAYICALRETETPSVLALTRQNVPHLAGTSAEGVAKGAYTVVAEEDPQLILVGSGSEVSLCVDAADKLRSDHDIKVRVVSMPCQEIYDVQPLDYKLSVFKEATPILSVEASAPQGWAKYSHAQICMNRYGASGKGAAVGEAFGFSADRVAEEGKKLVGHYGEAPAPTLARLPGAVPTPAYHH